MKVKVIIEEVISQQFEVEVSDMDHAYEEVRNMYKNGTVVLQEACVTEASVSFIDESSSTRLE